MTSRRKCPHCGRFIRMRTDGTMYRHPRIVPKSSFPTAVLDPRNECPGSRRDPKETAT